MQTISTLIGKPAPQFSLNAIASGRAFRLADYKGKPVLLLFVDYNTGRSTREVVISLRQKYPEFERLPIALLVDLRVVPRLLRGTAARFMETAYKQAAGEVPAGYDPADHLILLPDWSGNVFDAYHVGQVNQQMQLVVIGPDGDIQSAYQGPDSVRAAQDLVRPFME